MIRTTVQKLFVLPLVAAVVAFAPGALGAEFPFSEAELFFELNHTDGDLGIHALIDGGPYSTLTIEDPTEQVILNVSAQGRLLRQGLTELFFESAEPPFDELSAEKFFKRFPEGKYEIEGRRGQLEFEAVVKLSHVLAAPPSNVEVSGVPAAENCDDEKAFPKVSEPVSIDCDPVTESHPEIGKSGKVEIQRYQLFVEHLGNGNGEVFPTKFGVDLPPDLTEFVVPSEIIALGGTFKFEIIARTAKLNNTAIESCFVVE